MSAADEERDNLPEKKSEGRKVVPIRRGKWDGPPYERSGPPQNSLYSRKNPDELPTIAGRKPQSVASCRLCTIVKKLMERSERPLDFDAASWAEHDLVKMIYFDYTNVEISDHLQHTYGYRVRPESVATHKKEHIANPELVKLMRYQNIAERGLDVEYFKRLLKLPYMTIEHVMEGMLNGIIHPSVGDAQRGLEFLWKIYEAREESDKERRFIEAFTAAMEVAIDDEKQREQIFQDIFKEIRRRQSQDAIEG